MGKNSQETIINTSSFFIINKIDMSYLPAFSSLSPPLSLPTRSHNNNKYKYRLVGSRTIKKHTESTESKKSEHYQKDWINTHNTHNTHILESDNKPLSKFWDHIGESDPRLKNKTSTINGHMIMGSGYISSFSSPVGDVATQIGERTASDYGSSVEMSCHPFAPR